MTEPGSAGHPPSTVRPLRVVRDYLRDAVTSGADRLAVLHRLVIASEVVAAWVVGSVAGQIDEVNRRGGSIDPIRVGSRRPTLATWDQALQSVRRRLADLTDAAPTVLDVSELREVLACWDRLLRLEVAIEVAVEGHDHAERRGLRDLRNTAFHGTTRSLPDLRPFLGAFEGLIDSADRAYASLDLLARAGDEWVLVPPDLAEPPRPASSATPEGGAQLVLARGGRWIEVWPLFRLTGSEAGLVDEFFDRIDDRGVQYSPQQGDALVAYGSEAELVELERRYFDRDEETAPTWTRAELLAGSCVGRDEEVEQLVDLLDGPGGGRVVVTGEMGIGKSTVLAAVALASRGRRPVVVHHFLRDTADNSWTGWLRTVARALAPPGQDLPADPEALRRRVSQLLRQHEEVLIVCDGLDELAAEEPAAVERLAGIAARSNVGWLVSSRYLPAGFKGWTEVRLAPLAPGQLAQIAIDLAPHRLSEEVWASLRRSDDRAPEFLDHLVERANGNPLYVSYVIDDLAGLGSNEVRARLRDPAWLPRTLQDAILSLANQAGTGDLAVRTHEFLCLLAAAREPLTVGDLRSLGREDEFDDAVTGADAHASLRRLGSLIRRTVNRDERPAWELSHAGVKEALAAPGSGYTTGLTRAVRRLARAASRAFVDTDVPDQATAHLRRNALDYLTAPGVDALTDRARAIVADNVSFALLLHSAGAGGFSALAAALERLAVRVGAAEADQVEDRRAQLVSWAAELAGVVADPEHLVLLLDQIDALSGVPGASAPFLPTEDSVELIAPATDEVPVLRGHTGEVYGVLQLADRRLVSWSADGTARIWSATGIHELVREHDAAVTGARQLRSGDLLTWGADWTLHRWSPDGRDRGVMRHPRSPQTAFGLDAKRGGRDDGHFRGVRGVLECSDGSLVSWDSEGSAQRWTDDAAPQEVVAPYPYAPIAAVIESDRGVLLLVRWTGEVHRVDHDVTTLCSAARRDHLGSAAVGHRLLTWSADGSARLHSASATEDLTFSGRPVTGAVELGDGRLCFTDEDGVLGVFDVETRRRVDLGHLDSALSGAVASGPHDIVAVLDDGRLMRCRERSTPEDLATEGQAVHVEVLRSGLTWVESVWLESPEPHGAVRLCVEVTGASVTAEQLYGLTELDDGRVAAFGDQAEVLLWDAETDVRWRARQDPVHRAYPLGAGAVTIDAGWGRADFWTDDLRHVGASSQRLRTWRGDQEPRGVGQESVLAFDHEGELDSGPVCLLSAPDRVVEVDRDAKGAAPFDQRSVLIWRDDGWKVVDADGSLVSEGSWPPPGREDMGPAAPLEGACRAGPSEIALWAEDEAPVVVGIDGHGNQGGARLFESVDPPRIHDARRVRSGATVLGTTDGIYVRRGDGGHARLLGGSPRVEAMLASAETDGEPRGRVGPFWAQQVLELPDGRWMVWPGGGFVSPLWLFDVATGAYPPLLDGVWVWDRWPGSTLGSRLVEGLRAQVHDVDGTLAVIDGAPSGVLLLDQATLELTPLSDALGEVLLAARSGEHLVVLAQNASKVWRLGDTSAPELVGHLPYPCDAAAQLGPARFALFRSMAGGTARIVLELGDTELVPAAVREPVDRSA